MLLGETAPIREELARAPALPTSTPEERMKRIDELRRAKDAISDDGALTGFLARLSVEAIDLPDRTVSDLAFDAARRLGWRAARPVPKAVQQFLAQFRQAQVNANPRLVLPFLQEMTGWLSRIVEARRDLFFIAS